MSGALSLDIPEPKYRIGAQIVALIDFQLRYAEITEAYLQAQIIYNDGGLWLEGTPRWEYNVRIVNTPPAEAEMMIIAERTIIAERGSESV
jgi:hypothetical protein